MTKNNWILWAGLIFIVLAVFGTIAEDPNQKVTGARDKSKALQNNEQIITEATAYFENGELDKASKVTARHLSSGDQDIIALHQKINQVKRTKENAKKAESLINFMRNEIENMKDYDVTKLFKGGEYTSAQTFIEMQAEGYAEHHKYLAEAESYDLTAEQETVVQDYKKWIVKRQTIDLPKMRDHYGVALRKKYWVDDVNVRTFGKDFKIIEFAGNYFLPNRNKQDFYEDNYKMLSQLRFNEIRFKWYKDSDEWTYYKIDSPEDSEIAPVL